MKEQEPKSRAQFLEERVANSCLNYQSKHGFDTAFDLILEDVIELRKMVYSVSGETPKPDWNSKLFQANVENSSLQMELEAEQDKSGKAIDLIRSALAIAKRRGAETYWDGFQMQCENILKGSKPIDKVSGEAKTPDAEKIVAMYRLENHPNALRAIIYALELTGGSVPTPSDEEKIDVRIGMQLFLRKYKTGEEETAFIQGVRFGRGSAEQEKQQKS